MYSCFLVNLFLSFMATVAFLYIQIHRSQKWRESDLDYTNGACSCSNLPNYKRNILKSTGRDDTFPLFFSDKLRRFCDCQCVWCQSKGEAIGIQNGCQWWLWISVEPLLFNTKLHFRKSSLHLSQLLLIPTTQRYPEMWLRTGLGIETIAKVLKMYDILSLLLWFI